MVVTSPPTALTHAVITDLGAHTREGLLMPFKRPLKHISEVEMLGRRVGVRHFWIMPGTHIDDLGWDFLKDMPGYKIFQPGKSDGSGPTSATVKKDGGQEVFVEWPAGSKWNWEVTAYQDIIDTLDYLSQHIQSDLIAYSPQYIGKKRLRQDYEATNRLQSRLSDPNYDLSKLPFRQTKPELFFVSPTVLRRARAGMYVVSYDKNSAHPSAAQSMRTGYGDIAHLDALGSLLTPKQAGIYRVSFEINNSKFDGNLLPVIIPDEWVTLDVLLYAKKQGYTVDIKEAYVFKENYQFFKRWVPYFWQIRQALKDAERYPNEIARDNALETIKSIMNFTISALKGHPNWWADMVSLSRVARLANLAKVEEEQGKTPLYVYADDVAYVSPYDWTPEGAIPGMTARSTELGGYKHRYSLQLSSEMLSKLRAFASEKGDRPQAIAGKVHGYLKKIAEEKGVLRG